MITRTWKQLKDWIVMPELEVILHPSRRRLQWLGIFTIVGHLGFWWLWTDILPQPFEDGRIRLAIAMTGFGLFLQFAGNHCHTRGIRLYFSFVCWLQLPFFSVWMYWMNGCSAMWMATVATMVVFYFHLTDWRLASIGLIIGYATATLAAESALKALPSPPAEHWVVFGFALCGGLLLALSSANLRRERLQQSLTVIGIMAHELRTPLATMALIAQAIRTEAHAIDAQHAHRLEELASRMDALTRAINHHIDLQMSNARYTHPLSAVQLISATELVKQTIEDYPFGSKRERQCVQVVAHADFWFYGSARQFTQVLNNLIKNALYSLKSAQSRYDKGDLKIELGMRDAIGRIQITDRGVGIDPGKLKLIFEPFYSTANETGHGLGLAFCKQVLDAAQGTIMVHAEPALGATFTLQLPCQPAPTVEKRSDHEVSLVSPT